MMIQL